MKTFKSEYLYDIECKIQSAIEQIMKSKTQIPMTPYEQDEIYNRLQIAATVEMIEYCTKIQGLNLHKYLKPVINIKIDADYNIDISLDWEII